MIAPYMAVALQTTVRHVAKRDDVVRNLAHIEAMIDLVTHICSLELPVRLITLGEGAIQGFVDEIANLTPAEYADTMAADVPGWETDRLGEKAKQKGCFILGQLKTRHDKFPGRFFNTSFLIDPNGDVVWQHQKNIVLHVEHSTTPHDVYDEWVAEYGDGLDTFFPVARTEIGNIAGSVGVEGAFPECYRAFAMNGAEILYRGSLPEPWVSREIFEVQNRARAMDNTAYMIATNTGALIMPGAPGRRADTDRRRARRPLGNLQLPRRSRGTEPDRRRYLRRVADRYRGATPLPRECEIPELDPVPAHRALRQALCGPDVAEEHADGPARRCRQGLRRRHRETAETRDLHEKRFLTRWFTCPGGHRFDAPRKPVSRKASTRHALSQG